MRIEDGLTFAMVVPLACVACISITIWRFVWSCCHLSPTFPFHHHATMAIAPITGKLRKQFWLDIGCAFGLGISAGYAYW